MRAEYMNRDEDVRAYLRNIYEGRPYAVDDLLNYLTPILKAIARANVKNEFDRDDVVQDTLLRIAQSLPKLDSRKHAFGKIYVIERNVINDYYRQLHRTYRMEGASLEAVFVEEQFLTSELRTDLGKLLCKLSGSERDLISLRYWGNMTVRELAEFFHRTPSTMEYRLNAALQKLKGLTNLLTGY